MNALVGLLGQPVLKGNMDEDRITLEQFASELTGRHTMAVRVERGDIVIDDGGDDEYVIRAIPSGGGLNIEAFLHVYRRANAPHERAAASAATLRADVGAPVCPGPDCPYCSGESCRLCGAETRLADPG